jgi:glycosyltransferase involved in cell wall biosynthesis
MNVLFLCWEFPPNGSGIGRYTAEMSTALSGAGHAVTVLTSRAEGFPAEDFICNVRVLRAFDRRELRSGRVARLAVDVARDCHADWIEVPEHWGEGATLLKLHQRPPVVVKMHYNDVLKTSRYAQAWYPWQRLMIDLACLRQWKALRDERYSIEHADVLLAPCERILDEARREGLRLPIHYGVVPNPIRRLDNWTNAEADRPTLLLVGRLDIGKGLPYIRSMLEQLIKVYPDLRLEIAGGDSYARGLGSVRSWFRKQLGSVGAHVNFLGALSPAELDLAYRRAWVVIVPSRWDTFPQVVLEAMVRSKAIVASCGGGLPEMLKGTACVSVDPVDTIFSDSVAKFLSDSRLRADAGKSGNRKASSEYAPDCVAVSYVKNYECRL